MHERVHCHDEAASQKLPIAAAFWIILIASAEENSSLMQNLMKIYCSIHSVILNVTATQYTLSLNSMYCPHWPVQWSRHCSHLCIPIHSPQLPCYIIVTQTILIILTTAGFFPDRLHMNELLFIDEYIWVCYIWVYVIYDNIYIWIVIHYSPVPLFSMTWLSQKWKISSGNSGSVAKLVSYSCCHEPSAAH